MRISKQLLIGDEYSRSRAKSTVLSVVIVAAASMFMFSGSVSDEYLGIVALVFSVPHSIALLRGPSIALTIASILLVRYLPLLAICPGGYCGDGVAIGTLYMTEWLTISAVLLLFVRLWLERSEYLRSRGWVILGVVSGALPVLVAITNFLL